jgi:hypothetical protein
MLRTAPSKEHPMSAAPTPRTHRIAERLAPLIALAVFAVILFSGNAAHAAAPPNAPSWSYHWSAGGAGGAGCNVVNAWGGYYRPDDNSGPTVGETTVAAIDFNFPGFAPCLGAEVTTYMTLPDGVNPIAAPRCFSRSGNSAFIDMHGCGFGIYGVSYANHTLTWAHHIDPMQELQMQIFVAITKQLKPGSAIATYAESSGPLIKLFSAGTVPMVTTAILRGGPAVTQQGSATPVSGDFNGDGRSDILWYNPGTTGETLWLGQNDGSFSTGPKPNVNGTFTPVSGDFNGDGRSDILWYSPKERDALWLGRANGTFTSARRPEINGAYRPIVGYFNNGVGSDILWYGVGTKADILWLGKSDGAFTKGPTPHINGDLRIAAGDFDCDGHTDIVGNAHGDGSDMYLRARTDGSLTTGATSIHIDDNARIVAADLTGDQCSELIERGISSGSEYIRFGGLDGHFRARTDYSRTPGEKPIVGDFNGDGAQDVLWYGTGSTPETYWLGI